MADTIDELFREGARRGKSCRVCGDRTDRMFRLIVMLSEIDDKGRNSKSVSQSTMLCDQHAPVVYGNAVQASKVPVPR